MLPEAGATELIFLAAVALIVVGPKDLPILMRKLGQWVAKMRGLAAEFRSSFDELARQSELDELRKEVEALRNERMPDVLTNLQPTFDEVSAGLDPSGYNIMGDYAAPPEYPATQVEAAAEPVEAAPKRARAPRKPKAEAVAPAEAETPAKPKRVRRAKAAEEAEG